MNIHHEFGPEFLRLVPTKQRLTSTAGLGTLVEAFDLSPLREPFTKALPERVSLRSSEADRHGLIQLAKYSEEEKEIALAREKPLPKVEIGRFHWRPSWNEGLMLPVVVKRTRRTDQLSLLDGEWKYYGVVTNQNLAYMSFQELMEFHNKRGNAENFIREEKYGYDLKHFPCLEMKANHAYGLIAMAAHNILRWVAIHDNPSRPKFSKGLREKFIHIPGKVVSHARTLVLKVRLEFIQKANRVELAAVQPLVKTEM